MRWCYTTNAMRADTAEKQSGCEANPTQVRAGKRRAGKLRLLALDDLDRRTASYRRACELIASIEGDLGGSDQLSTAEHQIAQRAAMAGVMIEDIEVQWVSGKDVDLMRYATLVNVQRRQFECLGLQRRARDAMAPRQPLPAMPPLSELLQQRESSGV
jgi:hypothetical protein